MSSPFRIIFSILFFFFLSFGNIDSVSAQQVKGKTRILFLFDASGSMYAKMDEDIRINVAKRLLSKIIDSLRFAQNVEVALRVYGHQSPTIMQDCKDTRLEVPFSKNNHDQIKEKIKSIVPKGTTLIAHSLTQAAYDFPTREPNSRHIIILITDGIEECDGDPCAVSEAMQKNGVILKPFIIGIGSTVEFKKAFDCVGRYYDANTEESLDHVLNVVITQALNNTTAQVNLLDIFGKPSETNVNMTFYDSHSGQMLYNYLHAINDRGNPDTVQLDPSYTYNIVVHTMPPVFKNKVELNPGKHNIIGIDAPQGFIQLKVDGLTAYEKLQCVVTIAKNPKTINVQDFNTTRKYIVGKYDLEILSIPRIYLKEVEVKQNATTNIAIPQPGKLYLTSSSEIYGAIYRMDGDKLEHVYEIDLSSRRQHLLVQPGTYKIVYRSKNQNKTIYTFEKEFKITSGGSTTVTF